MTLRANVRAGHLLRLTAVGLFCLGFGLWSLYDGAVAYPNQQERANEFLKLKEEGRLEDWAQVAAERGWQPYDPGEPKTDAQITAQFYMLALAGGAGVLVLLNVARSVGRWIEMDEDGLTSSRGQRLTFDQVTKIDKKKWDKKGIARLHYQDNSRQKVFVLDDFIYDRPSTDEMLRQVELQVGLDKIVNGNPEPPPKAEAATEDPQTASPTSSA